MAADDISAVLSELPELDDSQAAEIWNYYFPKLMNLARQRMQNMPRRTADEEDVALSAINSFFNGAKAGRFDQLGDRDELWALLVTITSRKVNAHRKYLLAKKRGEGKNRGESVFGDLATGNRGINQVVDERTLPTLAEHVIEQCRELLDELNDEKLQQTAILRFEGFTYREIADRLGCTEANIKKRIPLIKMIWEQHLDG